MSRFFPAALFALAFARIAAGEFRNDSATLCRAQAAVSGPALFADPAHAPAIPDVCGYPNEYPGRLGTYFRALFQSFDGFNWRDSLAAVAIPRLVIHGARDNTPLAGNREWVAGQANAPESVFEPPAVRDPSRQRGGK